jgi:hypothetical protein
VYQGEPFQLPDRSSTKGHGHPRSGPWDSVIHTPASQGIAVKDAASLACTSKQKNPRTLEAFRTDYLLGQNNRPEDIAKFKNIIKSMPGILLEIGCGSGEAALAIAMQNPHLGVIATDLYDWNQEQACHAYYARVARNWREGLLPAQKNAPANLVFLRTQAEILQYLPDNSIDTLLLLNPEPKVAKSFLDLMQRESLFVKIKKGSSQIVILPYSREMGIMACGGFEFEHDTDWSRGLGFIFESKLPFKPGPAVLWGVDLRAVSAYTGNSTQRNVYICGEKSEGQAVAPTGQDNSHNRQ